MKVAQGRVINGTIVTETQLPEGARVAIVMDDDQSPFDLEPEDEVAIASAVKALDAGGGRPVSDLESMLSRYRQDAFPDAAGSAQ